MVEKVFQIGLAVLTQYRRETENQPASKPASPLSFKYRSSKRRAGNKKLS